MEVKLFRYFVQGNISVKFSVRSFKSHVIYCEWKWNLIQILVLRPNWKCR